MGQVREAAHRAVLRRMGIQASRVYRIAHRSNTHWIVETAEGRSVLRRYAPNRSPGDAAYELRLLEHLNGREWPVPVAVVPPVEWAGSVWCLFRYVSGRAPALRSAAGIRAEQRRRGRLLARLHADMADFAVAGQRPGWCRADEGLVDRTGRPPVDQVLRAYERTNPEAGRVLRTHADRTRDAFGELLPRVPAPVVIHGDLTPWNIRYERGTLSGVIDFDAAHLDLRVADFALSWRGRYDEVLRGYEEESPLEPVERALLVPVYSAWIIASAVAAIDAGESTEWAVKHLLRIRA
jgi:Ser/Thr protein kinase RdoA (MazF antagonist)